MFHTFPIYRRPIARILLVIACCALSPCRTVAAVQKDRAPELQRLIGNLVEELQVRYHDQAAQHRTHYNQVRQAIGKWNASARSDADFELMAGWLRAAHRTAEQGGGQALPPVPTLSAQVSRQRPEPLAVHVARKTSETQIVAINLSEFHSRIRGTNRELRKVETKLSLPAKHSAPELANMARLLANLAQQRDFLTLYYQSLSTPEQANTPRLLPADTAMRLLAEQVTRLRHTLRRRGTGNANQERDRLLLTEASRLLNELRAQ